MKKIRWNPRLVTSLFITLLMCTLDCLAQEVIKGFVKDGNDEPLPGVSVAVKGATNVGTITNVDGKYSINAHKNDVLVFSYIGMVSQEVKVGNKTNINITLKEDVSSLDEIVVVGYGTQKRGSLTAAISTVSDKEILKAPTMGISNIIGARVAGISAVQASGQPGADNASLSIRGQSGIIYVIDGIRRSASDFNGLDPNEIESVSVLKDASAVAVYGLDANGAFIVTTKKGQTDKVTISYTGTVGISQNAEEQEWRDMLIGTIKPVFYKVIRKCLLSTWCAKCARVSTDGEIPIGTIKYMEPVFANIIIFQHQEEVKRFVSSHLSVIWRKKEI